MMLRNKDLTYKKQFQGFKDFGMEVAEKLYEEERDDFVFFLSWM